MSARRLLAPIALAALACQQTPTPVSVRSLERSTKVAFVCLGAPDDPSPGRPLESCGASTTDLADYVNVPTHLFGLVTQTVRGELAVVDVTGSSVFDTDPSTPGYNFQPVGAQPVDVVVTPGGTAAFVSNAEPGREGIFALPSSELRYRQPDVRAWPACALPATPGAMVVMIDPPEDPRDPSSARASCDGAYGSPGTGALAAETRTPGARKLVVAIPSLGELEVIDAQDLLDRPRGSFDACRIERRIPLRTDVAAGPAAPPSADGGASACTPPAPTARSYRAHPSSIDVAPGAAPRVFVADDGAPVIHVLGGAGPCDLAELPPLLPSAVTDPRRVVRTSQIAVSPVTSDGAQFAYAVDLEDGSVMAFDVGPASTSRAPILRTDTPHDPFDARDRLKLGAPVRSVVFAQRDAPYVDASGVGRDGVTCDPDPAATDPAAIAYRTASDYSSGAGPRRLRGTFAFAMLASGQVAVIDVDDLDAPCRRPSSAGALDGCSGGRGLVSSGELSCNVVERHRLRAGRYFTQSDVVGRNSPSLQTTPFLLDRLGSPLVSDLSDDGKKRPKLLGPAGAITWVGGVAAGPGVLDAQGVHVDPLKLTADPSRNAPEADEVAARNWVAFDLTQPRAHVAQDWAVAYEGKLPGFDGHVARLQCADGVSTTAACDPPRFEAWDASATYCDRGVLPARSDVLQLTDDFLASDDPYWAGVGELCSPIRCATTFGSVSEPTSARDLVIEEAYQDHLVVVPAAGAAGVPDATDPTRTLPITCCFPTLVGYAVRPRGAWTVTGSVSGFLHDVVADPATLACVPSCDRSGAPLRTSRAKEMAPGASPPSVDDPALFRNAQMQFAIWPGSQPSERDMTFVFRVNGGFSPLVVPLASSTAVSPQSMTLVPPLGEIAVPDGASQGVVFVSLSSLTTVRQFL